MVRAVSLQVAAVLNPAQTHSAISIQGQTSLHGRLLRNPGSLMLPLEEDDAADDGNVADAYVVSSVTHIGVRRTIDTASLRRLRPNA